MGLCRKFLCGLTDLKAQRSKQAARPGPAWRAGGRGAYAALECVGGDITEKVVQVSPADAAALWLSFQSSTLQVSSAEAQLRGCSALRKTSSAGAQLCGQGTGACKLGQAAWGCRALGTGHKTVCCPNPAQSTREGGTVFIYGAMASFELKVAIPDLLFRQACCNLRGVRIFFCS